MPETWKRWIERNKKTAAGMLIFAVILGAVAILLHGRMKTDISGSTVVLTI